MGGGQAAQLATDKALKHVSSIVESHAAKHAAYVLAIDADQMNKPSLAGGFSGFVANLDARVAH